MQNLSAGWADYKVIARDDSARVLFSEDSAAFAVYICHTVFKYRAALIANLNEAIEVSV